MKRRLGEALNIPISKDISKCPGSPIIQGRVKTSTFCKVLLKSQKELASCKVFPFKGWQNNTNKG